MYACLSAFADVRGLNDHEQHQFRGYAAEHVVQREDDEYDRGDHGEQRRSGVDRQ
jgi:hypothetical protein